METQFEPESTPAKEKVINIGKSVFVKGELAGDEDLIIEGRVEGKIELKDHNIVVGPNGKLHAQINAKNVIVRGRVTGNVTAAELVEIKASGSVVGDVKSSRISIAEGAYFKGSVDLRRSADIKEKFHLSEREPAKVNTKQPALAELQAIQFSQPALK